MSARNWHDQADLELAPRPPQPTIVRTWLDENGAVHSERIPNPAFHALSAGQVGESFVEEAA